MLYVVLHISKHVKQWKKSGGHHFVSLRGRRSKGKGKGIWARDHASLAFFSRLKLPFPKHPFPSLSNACHAAYHFVPECNHGQESQTNQSCQFFCSFLLPRFVYSPSQPFFCVITQHSSLPLLPMNGHTTGFHPCQSNATTSPLYSDALPSVVAHAQ